MSLIVDALSYGFMQNAIVAAVLASLVCGVVGTLVVVNRLVFLSGGVAHAAYGGVGLAFALGLPVMACTIGFTAAVAMLMAWITLKRRDRADTVIGALWAAGMALGVILLDLSPGYNVDLMSYLFGSILAVPGQEVWIMAGLALVVLAVATFFHADFLAVSFDAEFARTAGAPATGIHFLLLGMTAVAVVMIIQVVGLILVIALLTIPPYMAERSSRTLAGMMVRACGWSLLFCLGGLAAAYVFNVTSGAAIVAVGVVVYTFVSGWALLRSRFARAGRAS